MTTTPSVQASGITQQKVSSRVQSIDIFRGLTMVVMIFVNDLSDVRGLPSWTYHMPANADAMTYVDMVFPCFLFIVGMSLPLAVKRRLKQNPSQVSLWLHIALRALALVVLGLILANAEKGSPSHMRLNSNAWALLALLGAVLVWGVYGDGQERTKLVRVVRIVGIALIVGMFAIFRRVTPDGHVAWIDGSYPEILGLIGFTYVAVCLLYIPTRRWLLAPLGWLAALVAFNAFSTSGRLDFLAHQPLYVWPFGNGSMASIAMAGVVASSIFMGAHRWQKAQQKMLIAFSLAIAALCLGWFLTPLGISKIRATPTWCLYSIGASLLLFIALYWICDVKKQLSWAFFARPAGSNTLLTYLLPDIYSFLGAFLGFSFLLDRWNFGWPGVLRSVCFTIFILLLAAMLTKLKIRMQL